MNICPPTYRSSAALAVTRFFVMQTLIGRHLKAYLHFLYNSYSDFFRFKGCNCKIVDQLEMSGKESFN